jgi:hypothetical protein
MAKVGITIEFRALEKNITLVTIREADGTAVVVDQIIITSARQREQFVERHCKAWNPAARKFVEQELLKAAEAPPKREQSKEDRDSIRQKKLEETPQDVRDAAERMLASADLLHEIAQDLSAIGIAGERDLALTTYLVGTSRLLPQPLSAIIQGPSSSGKSFVLESVARLFPAESVLHATDLTPQSLFYVPPDYLVHRFIVAGERQFGDQDELADKRRALRELQSNGCLTKLVTNTNGRIETKHLHVRGPISFCETTTQTFLFDEDQNRCLLLNTDETPAQTRRILDTIGAAAAGRTCDAKGIIERHHALQRMLAQYSVVIPYAPKLAELLDGQRVEIRRAYPQVLATIQATALLHQRQRDIDDTGILTATVDDYKAARELLVAPLQRSIGGAVSPGAQRTHAAAGRALPRETVQHDRSSSRHRHG